jgi:hypothetical protein
LWRVKDRVVVPPGATGPSNDFSKSTTSMWRESLAGSAVTGLPARRPVSALVVFTTGVPGDTAAGTCRVTSKVQELLGAS